MTLRRASQLSTRARWTPCLAAKNRIERACDHESPFTPDSLSFPRGFHGERVRTDDSVLKFPVQVTPKKFRFSLGISRSRSWLAKVCSSGLPFVKSIENVLMPHIMHPRTQEKLLEEGAVFLMGNYSEHLTEGVLILALVSHTWHISHVLVLMLSGPCKRREQY
jgi:hypothetical protein